MQKAIGSREQKRLTRLLRQVREERDLHQADVARMLKKPQSFVSRYESGQRRLDLVELRQVCRALGVSLPEFVARFEDSLKPRRAIRR